MNHRRQFEDTTLQAHRRYGREHTYRHPYDPTPTPKRRVTTPSALWSTQPAHPTSYPRTRPHLQENTPTTHNRVPPNPGEGEVNCDFLPDYTSLQPSYRNRPRIYTEDTHLSRRGARRVRQVEPVIAQLRPTPSITSASLNSRRRGSKSLQVKTPALTRQHRESIPNRTSIQEKARLTDKRANSSHPTHIQPLAPSLYHRHVGTTTCLPPCRACIPATCPTHFSISIRSIPSHNKHHTTKANHSIYLTPSTHNMPSAAMRSMAAYHPLHRAQHMEVVPSAACLERRRRRSMVVC